MRSTRFWPEVLRMRDKIVLAYSGGLDTSIIIPWLHEHYDADVIAYVGDVGQGDDLDAVVDKAYATGASKVIVEDLRDEFVTDFVFPAIRAGGIRLVDHSVEIVALADVTHVRDDVRGIVLVQPRNDYRCIQPARVGENDFVTHSQYLRPEPRRAHSPCDRCVPPPRCTGEENAARRRACD